MNFLSPLFFIGALAVAGPLFFHLIRRTTRHRALFSSVMLLSPTPPRLTERSRFEHLLLLILRCLALGLLALGFSRPFWRQTAAPPNAPAATRRVVILLDVSASMRRAGLWAQAKDRVAAVLRTVGPGDQAAIFAYGRRLTPLVSFEAWNAAPVSARADLALSRVAAAAPGWEDAHLGDALIAAAELLTEGAADQPAHGPRQIYLVSDLKAGSRLGGLPAYDWPKTVELAFEPVKAGHPTNAGIQLIADSPDADPQAAPSVRVRVSNAADSTREQFQVGWALASGSGYLRAPDDIYVPPGQSRVVALPVPAGGGTGKIVLTGDQEDFDNTLYVAAPQKQHWTVLYWGADQAGDVRGPRYFLERALPQNPHLAVAISAHAPDQAAAPAELAAAKVVFATDAIGTATADALRAELLRGKLMVFAPRSAAAAPTLARLLAVPAVALTDAAPADYAMLGEIDFRHPLFAPFADPHYSDFTKIHIWKYRRFPVDAVPGARVVARFDRGDPAVVDIPVGQGRLIVLLTGWNPSDSQLAISSKFVPMVAALLEYAGGTTDEATQYTVGDALPDGFKADATRPGLYSTPGGATVAVNLAASESRTEPMAADELERYGAPGIKRAPDPAQLREQAARLQAADAEGRQKLWRWILGATGLVLLLESALAGWTARRRAPAAALEGASP
jgi:hypothetical protein